MPAGSTYTPIATTTLGSSAASYTFSSIPSTYTDLILVVNTIVTSGASFSDVFIRFNGDTGSNYSNTYLLGFSPSSPVSGRAANATVADCGYLTSNSGNPNTRIINIMNYSNTTTNKRVISRGASVNSGQTIVYVNSWRNTAAINSILIYPQSGNYAAGTTLTLYGIVAA